MTTTEMLIELWKIDSQGMSPWHTASDDDRFEFAMHMEREACAIAGFHACTNTNDAIRVRSVILARSKT